MVLPSNQRSRVKSLVTYEGDRARGVPADGGDGGARGRDRRQPRQPAGAPEQRAARRPALRGHAGVDGRGADGRRASSTWSSRPPTWSTATVSRLHYRVDVNTLRREDDDRPGDERGRPVHGHAEPAGGRRPVPPQPHDGRLHRHRSARPTARSARAWCSIAASRTTSRRAPGTATRARRRAQAAPTAVSPAERAARFGQRR